MNHDMITEMYEATRYADILHKQMNEMMDKATKGDFFRNRNNSHKCSKCPDNREKQMNMDFSKDGRLPCGVKKCKVDEYCDIDDHFKKTLYDHDEEMGKIFSKSYK